MKSAPVLTGQYAGQEASRKARYGRKEWILWRARDGQIYATHRTPESIKTAMLATGTAGHFSLIGTDGHGMRVSWRIAVNILRQSKLGYI